MSLAFGVLPVSPTTFRESLITPQGVAILSEFEFLLFGEKPLKSHVVVYIEAKSKVPTFFKNKRTLVIRVFPKVDHSLSLTK